MTEIQTTGTQDRAIWVKLLWKISYPVIHNLAEGTLHQNMPIETRSGETAGYKDMTHLEAVGRTLAGGCPLGQHSPMMIQKKANYASRCVKKY